MEEKLMTIVYCLNHKSAMRMRSMVYKISHLIFRHSNVLIKKRGLGSLRNSIGPLSHTLVTQSRQESLKKTEQLMSFLHPYYIAQWAMTD